MESIIIFRISKLPSKAQLPPAQACHARHLAWERGCAGPLLSFASLSGFPVIPFPRSLNPPELELGRS